MNKITRYTLLLSLSCLTSVPTRAEVVSSGDKLLEIISNNQTGSTVSIELGNNIILPQNVDVNGNAVVDGTEQKYKIDGNGGAGFVLGNGESLTIQNTVLTNFGGQTATGLIVDNAAGGKVVLNNVTVESNKLTPLHTGQTYMPSGAFIANKGTMAINGTFNDNFLGTEDSVRGNGGFITNDDGHITEITGEFTNNTAQRMYDGGSDMYGGILWQGGSSALIDEIDAVFKNNTARAGNGSAYGGVMYINHGKINTLAGTYENNQALSDKSNAAGGVIFNKNEISVIRADFNNNKALGKETGSQYSRSTSLGGAIYNNGTIDRIENSTFTGNIAKAVGAQGGAIYNYASYSTSGVINEIVNTSFFNNQAENTDSIAYDPAQGGAIYQGSGTLTIKAENGGVSEFTGNTVKQHDGTATSNAVYMAKDGKSSVDSVLKLEAAADGSIIFNDGIDGANGYAINIGGNDKGTVNFNRTVANAGLISISGAHVRLDREDRLNGSSLTLNGGALHFDNGSFNNGIAFKNLTGGSGELHIDVDTVLKTADEISAENLYGTVNVVARNTGVESSAVYAKSAGKEGIRFAEIANPGSGKFNILRVENSAYEWEAEATRLESGADEWSMHVKKSEDGQKPVVVAEAAGYMGLTAAGFEQTRGMIRNIEDKTAATMVYVGPCGGYYDNCYNREPLYNLWISPVYASSSVDAPVKFDADVYGFEAGGDLQQDAYNRLGLFVSYRHGEYDLDGKNDFYVVNTSGDIDIDSYIGGLYYRYTDRTLWAMTTVFAGVQNADLKTADGVKADSDAAQFGAAFSTGYAFMLSDSFAIEPRAGLSYTRIGWDDIRDRYGKTANYDTASQFELEAGIKFEKTLPLDGEPAKLYLQPGIVQVFGSGDKVAVSGLNTVHTLDDMTLGSVKGGVSYRVNDRINVFGNVGWLFGSDYENVSANFGLNYAF